MAPTARIIRAMRFVIPSVILKRKGLDLAM
jgi:hypothetical protein